jgi:hypothetical protein
MKDAIINRPKFYNGNNQGARPSEVGAEKFERWKIRFTKP